MDILSKIYVYHYTIGIHAQTAHVAIIQVCAGEIVEDRERKRK